MNSSINRKVDQKITCKGDQKNPGVLCSLCYFFLSYQNIIKCECPIEIKRGETMKYLKIEKARIL